MPASYVALVTGITRLAHIVPQSAQAAEVAASAMVSFQYVFQTVTGIVLSIACYFMWNMNRVVGEYGKELATHGEALRGLKATVDETNKVVNKISIDQRDHEVRLDGHEKEIDNLRNLSQKDRRTSPRRAVDQPFHED